MTSLERLQHLPGGRRRVVACVNLKGGSGKTTSAVFLAHQFAGAGHQVLLVDADPLGSALQWSSLAEWSTVAALGLPVRDLHRQLPGITGDRYDVIVIDTPPLEERAGIVLSAMREATDIVVPMAPTMMELDRVAPVWDAIAEIEPLRETPPNVAVLLNRTVTNAASTDTIRNILTEQGHYVLTAAVARRERYAQAFGGPVPGDDLAYGAVAVELVERAGVAA